MCLQCGVDACQQPLCGGLFIACRTIDLPGKEQAPDGFGFQRAFQAARVKIIVFDGVTGTRDMRIFQAFDGAHQVQLHIEWQAGGNSIRIDFMGAQPLRFQKNLVCILVRKAGNLVFDGRAIARPYPLDHAGKQRRAIQTTPDDVVRAQVGVCNPARQLLRVLLCPPQKGKHRHRRIPGLLGHYRIIHTATINARRRAGLQPAYRQLELSQSMRQADRRRVACTPGLIIGLPDMDQSG